MAILGRANEYFDQHLHATAWQDASDITKSKALGQAQRQLELYRGRASYSRFFNAVCEQALWLLRGDKRAELQQAGVRGFSIGNMSEQFDAKGRPPSIAPQAWAFLRGSGVKGGQIC